MAEGARRREGGSCDLTVHPGNGRAADRARLVTEAYARHDGLPVPILRARVFELSTIRILFTCIGWMESVSGSVSESESKGAVMGFGHEKLDVYRAAIEYVGWAYRYCEMLKGHRNAKDQLLRASQAIPIVWI